MAWPKDNNLIDSIGDVVGTIMLLVLVVLPSLFVVTVMVMYVFDRLFG